MAIISFITNTLYSQAYKEGEKDEDGVRCLTFFYSEKELYEVLDFLIENSVRTKLFDAVVFACGQDYLSENMCAVYVTEDPGFATVPQTSWARIKHIGDTIKMVSKVKDNRVINDIIAYCDTMSSRYEPFWMYEHQIYSIGISSNNHLDYYKRIFEYLKKINKKTLLSDNIEYFMFSKKSISSFCFFLMNDYKRKTNIDSVELLKFTDEVARYAIEEAYDVPILYGSKTSFFHKYRKELLNQLKTNIYYPEKYWEFYKNNMMDFTVVDTIGIPQIIKDEALKWLKDPEHYYNPNFIEKNKEKYPDIEVQELKIKKIYRELGEYIEKGVALDEALTLLYKDQFPYIINKELLMWSVYYIEEYNDKDFLSVLLENRSEWEKFDKYSYKELDKYLNK